MVLALALASNAHAAVLSVGVGHPYATLPDAIAAAAEGDVLWVRDAGISGAATVTGKHLTLATTTGTVWSSPGLLLTDGADVAIYGFRFEGDLPGMPAVDVVNATLELNGCTFDGVSQALRLLGTAHLFDTAIQDAVTPEHPIDAQGGFLGVYDSRFTDLQGYPRGAIHAGLADVVVERTLFARTRGADSGGLYCGAGCSISDSVFFQPQASLHGAAVESEGDLAFERNRVCEAQGGALWAIGGGVTIRNNAFVANSGTASGAVMEVGSVSGTIAFNTIVLNATPGQGIVNQTGSTLTFTGNVVAGNSSLGSAVQDLVVPGGFVSSYNAWAGNSEGDASFPLGGTELVGVDPMLRGTGHPCSWAYVTPRPGSPLLDAADPAILDLDGSRADIGALGGPGAP